MTLPIDSGMTSLNSSTDTLWTSVELKCESWPAGHSIQIRIGWRDASDGEGQEGEPSDTTGTFLSSVTLDAALVSRASVQDGLEEVIGRWTSQGLGEPYYELE